MKWITLLLVLVISVACNDSSSGDGSDGATNDVTPVVVDDDHDHDEDHHEEDVIAKWIGEEQTFRGTSPCELYLVDAHYHGENIPENLAFVFRTGFSHGGDIAPDIEAYFVDARTVVGSLQGPNGEETDRIIVRDLEADYDITTAKRFSIKWTHIDHFHQNICQNLVLDFSEL